jgi:hypothetical protein
MKRKSINLHSALLAFKIFLVPEVGISMLQNQPSALYFFESLGLVHLEDMYSSFNILSKVRLLQLYFHILD